MIDITEERPFQPRSHKDIGEWNLQTVSPATVQQGLSGLGTCCPGILPTVSENLFADAFPIPLSRKAGCRPFGQMGT